MLVLPAVVVAQADGTPAPRPVVRGIEVVRQEIFDSTETDSWPERLANALHILTRPRVIRRELLFRVGEPYDSVLVAESTRNLRALGIFRDVRIDSVATDSGIVLRVVTRDSWTTRIGGKLRTTGGQASLGVSFLEANFLGTATRAGISFSHDPVRTTLALEASQPRFFGTSVGVGSRWEHRSDGDVLYGRVVRPFYSIADPHSYFLKVEFRDETVRQYLNGIDIAVDSLAHRAVVIQTGGAWAVHRGPRGYVRLGVLGQIARNDYQPTLVSTPLPRTVKAAVGGFVEWSHDRYASRTGFETFSRTEDVNLSSTVRVGVYAAPSFLGYDSAGVGAFASAQTGGTFPNGFFVLSGISDGLITAAGVDSGGTLVSATVAWNPDSSSLLLVHGSGGWMTDPAPGYEFDLGLTSGPRAFGTHSFTGNRTFFTTAEARRLLWPRIFGVVGVGVAAFADYGGAWWSGSPVRTGTNVGLGLRLGDLRSSQGAVSRVDLSWRFANDAVGAGWVFSLGRGFVFPLSPERPTR